MSNFRVNFYKYKEGIVENVQLANTAPSFAPPEPACAGMVCERYFWMVLSLKFMMLYLAPFFDHE